MDATCSGELGTAIKELPPSEDLVEVLVDGARYGDMEDVQSALQHGVNINSADSSGRTGSSRSSHFVQLHCCLEAYRFDECSFAHGSSQWPRQHCLLSHTSWRSKLVVYATVLCCLLLHPFADCRLLML